jgi:hypothetical protein
MSSANIELNIETKSSEDFPMVALYLNKEIGVITIKEEDRTFFIKKIEMENNCYEVPRTIDILSAIEITGKFERGSNIADIYKKIKSIDIKIGDEIITKIYLQNNICDISANNYFYTIHIPLDNILYNIGFIPIVSLRFHEIKIHIVHNNGYSGEYDFYLLGAVLNSVIRRIYLENPTYLLFKDFYKYDGIIHGNQLKLMNEYGRGMNSTNMISSIYFNFEINIRSRLKYIELKTGNNRSITIIPLSHIRYINDHEFIIDKFYYKIFLFNTVIIEFGLTYPFYQINFSMITTNYNILAIENGFGEKVFMNLSRSISGDITYGYDKIPENIYQEKVVPKADTICAISHAEFEEGEERIICGECFSSYRKESIEMWFQSKEKRLCPCCREEDSEWWYF